VAYTIAGLPVEPFKPFFGLPDEELAKSHIVRVTADAPVGYPCRVLLADAKPGDTHLEVEIVAIDDEIIEWLQRRERRKGRADSRINRNCGHQA